MNTKNTIYKKIVTKKIVDGVMKRTYTLVPVVAKLKDKLSKEEIAAKKAVKVYKSTGIHKKISQKIVEKDDKGNIIPSDMWSEKGKKALVELRRVKALHDAETTETITLKNGFKKKIRIPYEFKALPSMKLTKEERALKLQEHREIRKTRRIANKMDSSKSKVIEPAFSKEVYDYNRNVARTKQQNIQDLHEKVIQNILKKLAAKGKPLNATIDAIELEKNSNKSVTVNTVSVTGTKKQLLQKTMEISKTHAGATLKLPKTQTYVHNLHKNAA